MQALPSLEREALLLTHHAGLTHAEAAAALGVPRQTLTSQAGRGFDTLARRLGRDPSRAASALAAIPVLEPSVGGPDPGDAGVDEGRALGARSWSWHDGGDRRRGSNRGYQDDVDGGRGSGAQRRIRRWISQRRIRHVLTFGSRRRCAVVHGAGERTRTRGGGPAFDQEFAAQREGWSPGVPRARRMLEEYRLKGDFCADLHAVLTDPQRAALMDPTYRGRAGLDLNDTTLMILHTSPVITGADVGQVRARLGTLLRKKLGLAPESAAPVLDGLLDAFLARALRGMDSVPASQARCYSYTQGLQAGEAMADLVDGVLRDVDLAPPVREALLGDPTWYIPRLVSP